MGLLEDLDELDRRVFGEAGLRVICRCVIPLLLLTLGLALLLRAMLGERHRSPFAGLFIVASALALLAVRLGPPPRESDPAHVEPPAGKQVPEA